MPGRCVSVIGGLAVDLITVATRLPEQGETIKAVKYSKSLGGKGANSALAVHRTSHVNPRNLAAAAVTTAAAADESYNGNGSLDNDIEVRMIGAVGSDEYGAWYRREMADNGVDVSGVRVVEGEMTGICTIIVEADFGENRILMTTAANDTLLPSEFETLHSLANGPRPDLVVAQLEIPRETIEQILQTASEHGVEVLLNPAPAYHLLTQTYKHITHLIMNETEAAILSGRDVEEVSESTWAEIADEFLMMGVTNVVITLGAKGAYFATAEGQKDHVPAIMVKVVDTTGAGDTFVGTYASEYLRQKDTGEWDIKRAVSRACQAAAHTIGKLGAQEAIPWLDEIDKLQVERPVTVDVRDVEETPNPSSDS